MGGMTQQATTRGQIFRRGLAMLWLIAMVLAGAWTVSGLGLCVAVVGAQRNPPPADASLPWNGWTLFLNAASLVALVLSFCPFAALLSGLVFLLGTGRRRLRWTLAWLAVSGASVAIEIVLLREIVKVLNGPGLGGVAPAPMDWGPVELGAGFGLCGLAMLVVLFAAAARALRAPGRLVVSADQ
jgi:hypothetical protein